MLVFFALASAAEPQSVSISYTATFEMDSTGDQLCGMTGLCDCSTTYLGEGTLLEKADDRITFKGTWKVSKNTCGDKLTVWVPPDGAAFHTLKRSGDQLSEWLVHRDASAHTRLESGMKEKGQYWINELNQPWKQTTWRVNQKDGTTLAMGVKLDANHDLAILVQ